MDVNEILDSSAMKLAKKQATKIASSRNKSARLAGLAFSKLDKGILNKKTFKAIKGDFLAALRMIKAYAKKEYKKIPTKSLIGILAGMVYFVMPIDFIPDFIPLVGFADDIALLAWIFSNFKHDIDEYRAWEQGHEYVNPTN
ncbi:YkvA family protein [Mangrovivirga sp. M17]|uniref:YkvA family protein n=1 Tax=Mangrovivirga halotolerans TaxID=2993936 RepID=A0ABT3RW30_9BACT|nr:YkvA family protein [Mangrovivirga halotolerans]MCX2745979.1 YkvA family protein [Mangrovivirga halotolerans]